jgi:hypothetical protein
MQTQPQLPAATNRSELFIGALTPDAQAHRQRCKTLPPMQPGEAERLMAEFLASRGSRPAFEPINSIPPSLA